MESDYGLLVSFPDQTESYVLGFEAGQLWETLKRESVQPLALRYAATMHSDNEEAFRRIARHFGCTAEFKQLGNGWSEVNIRRGGRPELRAVPTGDERGT